jgi:hypothetical protein
MRELKKPYIWQRQNIYAKGLLSSVAILLSQ